MCKTGSMIQEAAPCYPGREEIDAWAVRLRMKTEAVSVEGVLLEDMPVRVPFGNSPNTLVNRYVRFTADDGRRPFYGYWQPALNTPAPR